MLGSMRIDAHVHLWKRSQYGEVYENYGRPPELQPLLRDFTATDLNECLAEAGVARAVLIQLAQNDEHNDELLRQAAQEDCIGAVIGWADLRSEQIVARLEQLASNPLFRGIRDPLEGKPNDWLAQPEIRRGLSELARHGLLFELLIGREHWGAVAALSEALPELRLVINHFGKPTPENLADWDQVLLRQIAPFPQVYVKLSGFMALIPPDRWQDWAVADIQPFVDCLLERLGPRRLLAGTDWPVATLAGSYQHHTQVLHASLAALREEERRLILGENARRLYAID